MKDLLWTLSASMGVQRVQNIPCVPSTLGSGQTTHGPVAGRSLELVTMSCTDLQGQSLSAVCRCLKGGDQVADIHTETSLHEATN